MNRALRILVTSALVAGVIAAWAGPAVAEPLRAAASHTLSGRVLDAAAEGVNDVEVGLYQQHPANGTWSRVNWTIPAEDGSYTFTLAPGTYRIGVEPQSTASPAWEYDLPQYLGGVDTVAASGDVVLTMDVTLDFTLTENPVLSGTVTSAVDGSPIADAYVDLYWYETDTSQFLVDTTQTDESGGFFIHVPDRGSFLLGYRKNGWATEYLFDTPRWQEAELRNAGPWMGLDATLDPGVSFRIERAYSPFGTRLPSSWTNLANGVPYTIEVYRRVTPAGAAPEEWDQWWYLRGGTRSSWPDFFPAGTYKVKFVPPAGSYLPLWHAGVADEAAAQVVEVLPGQAIGVWARFGGFVKAKTSVKASASSVSRGKSVRLTVSLRDASLTGKPTTAQPGAPVKLQRSYNKRSWTTIATLTTGSAGTVSKSVKITRTTYFRAVPVTSATLKGSASSAVKVRAR